MNRPVLHGALIAAFCLASGGGPLFAADPAAWPWKSKLPPDPALVLGDAGAAGHGDHHG